MATRPRGAVRCQVRATAQAQARWESLASALVTLLLFTSHKSVSCGWPGTVTESTLIVFGPFCTHINLYEVKPTLLCTVFVQ